MLFKNAAPSDITMNAFYNLVRSTGTSDGDRSHSVVTQDVLKIQTRGHSSISPSLYPLYNI